MSVELNTIDLTADQRQEIEQFLKKYLPNTKVWAYGSRVKSTAKPSSDLDVVAFASKEQELNVAALKDAFEESYLPFRIDLFIWNDLPESFHKNIKAQHVVLQESGDERNPT